uniref:PID domain-containing protein n=1 Tax=Mastacembelus armatus TaxID=205130 RepID=A0A7N8XE23_9TELE
MADYIAYVAKDPASQRACHILECPEGRASEVINSIGQAFETRFHQMLSHTPSFLSTNARPEETIMDQKAKPEGEVSEHHDYYNVTPGKTPPPGGKEDLRIIEESTQDADIQGVSLCSPQAVSLYENCSITEETIAPPAGKTHQYTPSAH